MNNNAGMNNDATNTRDQPGATVPAGSVIFAGGGTGGHIFPALAIAEAIASDSHKAETQAEAAGPIRRLVIGADRTLDIELLTSAQQRGDIEAFATIPARPFGLRPRALARLARDWGTCVRESRLLIRDERERTGRSPVIVAMGGYVSAPPVRAAMTEKCPVVLVNLDAVPGKANRWIAHRADQRFVVGRDGSAFEPMDSVAINPIVRAQIISHASPAEARAHFGLDPDRPTLLVTGGSLGARTINRFMIACVQAHADAFQANGWQVLHQCGPDDAETLRSAYAAQRVPAVVTHRLEDMGAAWAGADLAVCRAGAGTVAEVWATRTPAIFLPYPFHKDAHQRVNAAILTDAGAGVLGQDLIEPGDNVRANGAELRSLLTDPARRAGLADMLQHFGPADGAQQVARFVGAILGKR